MAIKSCKVSNWSFADSSGSRYFFIRVRMVLAFLDLSLLGTRIDVSSCLD